MLYFKLSLIQLLHRQWFARMKAIFVAGTKEKQLRFRGKLFGSCCSWEAGSVYLCGIPSGRPFWLHMCLSILWNRALKASRSTHTLPQTIQGHKHFPIFPQKNLPCPCPAEKLNLSSKDSSAQITQHCWCGRDRSLCISQGAAEVLGFPLAAEYSSWCNWKISGFLFYSCFSSQNLQASHPKPAAYSQSNARVYLEGKIFS